MLSITTFSGVLSSCYNFDAQTTMVGLTITKMIGLAKLLLLPFFLIRLVVHYVQYHLSLTQLIKSCYTSIITLCITFFLLHCYIDIFNGLDRLTCAIMSKFDWQEVLNTETIIDTETPDISVWQLFKNSLSNFAMKGFKMISCLTSSVTAIFRQQAIVFTLQVGPLAIAGSLLPGNFGQIAGYWLNMLISFLMWGVTIDLLDYSILSIEIEGISGLAASISNCVLYGLIGPLTSIYIGNTVGNSLFALAYSRNSQFLSYGGAALRKLSGKMGGKR